MQNIMYNGSTKFTNVHAKLCMCKIVYVLPYVWTFQDSYFDLWVSAHAYMYTHTKSLGISWRAYISFHTNAYNISEVTIIIGLFEGIWILNPSEVASSPGSSQLFNVARRSWEKLGEACMRLVQKSVRINPFHRARNSLHRSLLSIPQEYWVKIDANC